jgi:Fanconi anemia group M protein
MRVIADCREPAGLIAALRSRAAALSAAAAAAADGGGGAAGATPVEIAVEALDVGDYVIGPGAVVERKTGADFVASILDGRFAEQAAKLRATYDRVFWLVEGDPFGGGAQGREDGADAAEDGGGGRAAFALDAARIAGALSHLAVVEGATLVRTDSAEQTAELVLSLAKRFQDGRHDLQLRPTKPHDPRLLAEYIVSGLPRIGRGKARLLLERFGSVRGVFTASAAEIAAIRGFGRKTAEAIRSALDGPYEPPNER